MMRTKPNNMWRFLTVTVVCLANGIATAADFTWLNTPVSESWNTEDANWNGAGSVWVNDSSNNAVLGTSDIKNITVNDVIVGSITFDDDGYTLCGGTLNLFGNITVGVGQTATISTPITHTNVLSKLGNGTLAFAQELGTSNRVGAFKASAGTLLHMSGTTYLTLNGSDVAPSFLMNGGTFVMGGGVLKTTGGGYAMTMASGSLIVTNGLVDCLSYSEFLNAHGGPGKVIVSGNGTLDTKVLRIAQYNGPADGNVVNVNTGGTIRLSSFNIDGRKSLRGILNLNGGAVCAKADAVDFLGDGSTNWLTKITANVLEGGAVFDTQGHAISIKQPLISGASNDGGVIKRGAGILALRGTNTYNGGTSVLAGTVDVACDNNLGEVPTTSVTNLTFSGTSVVFRSSANYELHANRTLFISNDVSAAFDTQTYTQTVNGVISGAQGSLLKKAGAGTLVLNPGAGRTNSVSSLKNESGTLMLASGTFNITTNAPGQVYDVFQISGGTVLVGGGVLRTTGAGYLTLTGGNLLITNGMVNLCDGKAELLNAYTAPSGLTVSDQGVLDLSSLRISQYAGGTADSNVVNVNTGGLIRLDKFYTDVRFAFKGRVNLNGGKLVAKSSRDDFMGMVHTNWATSLFFTVREGGAVIDSNGFNMDSKQPLYSGAANDGGLTKKGAGMFTLATNNTYNGVTFVEAGTLRLGLDNALPPTNTVTVSSNAVFDVNGRTQTLAKIGGGGTMTNLTSLTVTDTVAPGDTGALGTLTLATTPAALAGAFKVNVATNGSCDRLHVQGNLNLSGLSLHIENAEQLDIFKCYRIASCTGALNGTFTTSNLPPHWLIRYDSVNRTVTLIYNHGTVIKLR